MKVNQAIALYGIHTTETELGKWVPTRLHYLKWLRSVAGKAKRQVFIGEFGLADRNGVFQRPSPPFLSPPFFFAFL